jgi:hypothetical protein
MTRSVLARPPESSPSSARLSRAGWVDALLEAELVSTRPGSHFAGERELGFRHALLRDGAYATLTLDDRARSHALAGEWLERHGKTAAMVLAHHFEAAGDVARASRFHLAAARRAFAAADLETAVALAERALGHASSGAERVECLGVLGEAHAWHDAWADAADRAGEVLALAVPGSEAWIGAMGWKQSAAMVLGRPDELLPAVAALTSVEGAPGTGLALVTALTVTTMILALAAQTAMAARVLAQMEEVVACEGPDDPRLRSPTDLAHVVVEAWGADACSRRPRHSSSGPSTCSARSWAPSPPGKASRGGPGLAALLFLPVLGGGIAALGGTAGGACAFSQHITSRARTQAHILSE